MSNLVSITEELKTLAPVQHSLGIRLSNDSNFFREWMEVGEEINEDDRRRLDQG